MIMGAVNAKRARSVYIGNYYERCYFYGRGRGYFAHTQCCIIDTGLHNERLLIEISVIRCILNPSSMPFTIL